MEEKKGFTLIELLAVIVILAVIALIATPIVLNIIGRARKGAFARSADAILKAANSYYTANLIDETETSETVFNCDKNTDKCVTYDGKELDIDGSIGDGTIKISESGKVEFYITNGKYCATKEMDKNNIAVKDGDCDGTVTPSNSQNPDIGSVVTPTTNKSASITIPYIKSSVPSNVNIVTCEYGLTKDYGSIGTVSGNNCLITNVNDGAEYFYKITAIDENGHVFTTEFQSKKFDYNGLKGIAYYDPTTGKKCTDYKIENSMTGTKEGCMKWYIYDDNGDGTVDMILDHNTTAVVAYNKAGDNSEMVEVKEALLADTSTWSTSARLISADEIAKITGNATFSSTSTDSDWFYLDNNSHDNFVSDTVRSSYAWLYNYTYCIGCEKEDSNTHGYWTSTPVHGDTKKAWRIFYDGSFDYGSVDNTTGGTKKIGLRPVITVSKADI